MRVVRRRVRRGERIAGVATSSRSISSELSQTATPNQRGVSTDSGEATTNATSHAEVERQLFVN